jgi:hypothetical protein
MTHSLVLHSGVILAGSVTATIGLTLLISGLTGYAPLDMSSWLLAIVATVGLALSRITPTRRASSVLRGQQGGTR